MKFSSKKRYRRRRNTHKRGKLNKRGGGFFDYFRKTQKTRSDPVVSNSNNSASKPGFFSRMLGHANTIKASPTPEFTTSIPEPTSTSAFTPDTHDLNILSSVVNNKLDDTPINVYNQFKSLSSSTTDIETTLTNIENNIMTLILTSEINTITTLKKNYRPEYLAEFSNKIDILKQKSIEYNYWGAYLLFNAFQNGNIFNSYIQDKIKGGKRRGNKLSIKGGDNINEYTRMFTLLTYLMATDITYIDSDRIQSILTHVDKHIEHNLEPIYRYKDLVRYLEPVKTKLESIYKFQLEYPGIFLLYKLTNIPLNIPDKPQPKEEERDSIFNNSNNINDMYESNELD